MTTIKSLLGNAELTISDYPALPSQAVLNGIAYSRSQILAALGVDELGCGCPEADDNLKEALARAEAAEAKLEKVREVINAAAPDDLKVRMYNRLRAALADEPALPTAPGSVIIATEVRGEKGEWCMAVDHDGEWSSIDGGAIDGSYYHGSNHITAWKPAKVVAE